MKVFISWSGEKSNKIAEVLKLWIKHVIQTVEPFVSSQDVSKGARWSTDIAKELQNTNFGILCVTKDNFQQPWLLFEAGALSKTIEKSYVVPLLFDLEPSDLQDSPLLQFQATSNSKEDIKKLVLTINSACEATSLETRVIDEAFEVWYPKLLESLSSIEPSVAENGKNEKQDTTEKTSQILEEILELTRMNQKLLRNPETKTLEEYNECYAQITNYVRKLDENETAKVQLLRVWPSLAEGISIESPKNIINQKYSVLVAISSFKDATPWLYDSVSEMIDTLISSEDKLGKREMLDEFIDFIERTIRITLQSDINAKINARAYKAMRDLPEFLYNALRRFLD